MKWFADWWGVEISAENESDEVFLRELVERLPKDADVSHVDGKIDVGDGPQRQGVEHEGFTITFNR